MSRCAIVGIGGIYRDHMLIVVVVVVVVQMAIMQVVDVTIMINGSVTASGRVHVNMIASCVHLMMRHSFSQLPFVQKARFGEIRRRAPKR